MNSVVTIAITVIMVLIMAAIVVSFIIALISKLRTKDGVQPKDDKTSLCDEAVITEKANTLSNNEIIAVLTAAVNAAISVNPDIKIQVKSFRRVSHNAPVWNYYGRKEQVIGKEFS